MGRCRTRQTRQLPFQLAKEIAVDGAVLQYAQHRQKAEPWPPGDKSTGDSIGLAPGE